MKNKFMSMICVYLCLVPAIILAQKHSIPNRLEENLRLSGSNRPELEKVIKYFKKDKDQRKLKAAHFLIENMDIHYSQDYYWVDMANNKVPFNEFDYPSLDSAVSAMDRLKETKGQLFAQDTVYEDLKNIKSQYLIHNIETAFKSWQSSVTKNVPFEVFCEYVLPYKATVEPVQDWRTAYQQRFNWISDSLKNNTFEMVLKYIGVDYRSWFYFTYGKEVRYEPLPRLGPQHLLFRKKGACEDVAALEVFTLRSQGIPVAYDIVPLWATSMGTHFFNTVYNPESKPIRFDVTTDAMVNHTLPREPSKVIRLTYSKQASALTATERPENIPQGFMQQSNYIDVTNEYWETSNINFELFPENQSPSTVYACMFSGGEWSPQWWAKAAAGKVSFANMPKGTVIMPAYYNNGTLQPAGYPKAHGFNNELLLKPDYTKKRTIRIDQQERYLILRPEKKYELYYWDKDWQSAGETIAKEGSKELFFDDVPLNALLLLVPEYSQGRERPFIIVGDNQRYWW